MKEKIIQFIQSRGPVLPKEVAKQFSLDTTFAGAHLSELVSGNKLLISKAKIGGSPVYYSSEQRPQLEMLYKYLNNKEQKAFDLLKNSKVLRDKTQDTVTRVALRNIKDFAVPLQVNLWEGPELFWKWYLLPKEEAEVMIKKQLNIISDEQKKKEEAKKAEQERLEKERLEKEKAEKERKEQAEKARLEKEKIEKENIDKKRREQQRLEDEKKREAEFFKQQEEDKRKLEEERSKILAEKKKLDEMRVLEREKIEIEKKRLQDDLKLEKERLELEKLKHEKQVKLAPVQERSKKTPQTKPEPPKEEQETLEEEKFNIDNIRDDYLSQIRKYFTDKKIEIIHAEVIRKNAEIDMLIKVPSVVGMLDYFCKAKNKKKCNDGDLSSAFVQGQLKKLPVLFLTPGDLTKKAEAMLENEFKNSLFVKKM